MSSDDGCSRNSGIRPIFVFVVRSNANIANGQSEIVSCWMNLHDLLKDERDHLAPQHTFIALEGNNTYRETGHSRLFLSGHVIRFVCDVFIDVSNSRLHVLKPLSINDEERHVSTENQFRVIR